MNIFFPHLSLLGFCFVLGLGSHCSLALIFCSSCLFITGAGVIGLFNHAYFPCLLRKLRYHLMLSNYLGSILEYFHNKHTIKAIIYIPISPGFSCCIYIKYEVGFCFVLLFWKLVSVSLLAVCSHQMTSL